MILEVKDKKEAKAFLRVPRVLYKYTPNWIAALDTDIEAIFDPNKNNFFEHGECTRWVLYDDHHQLIGRIAAFIDHHKTTNTTVPAGGIGFFESINDTEAAYQLFGTAMQWLQARGMKAMDGPVNFGENDKWWGLLVEGFKTPSYGMNYNHPYYMQLFESFGFTKSYDQLTNVLDATQPMPERFIKISDWVMQKKEYTFEHFSYALREKYFNDFSEIYNNAWCDFDNFVPIDMPTIRETFRQLRPLLDEKIIWFAYHEGEPIAFIVCVPDVNQILRHLHGRLDMVGKLKFLWYKHTTTINRLRIIVMGCKQRFQNHGIESALIRCLQKEVLPRHTIHEVELAWVGDFNKKMLALHYATGAVPSKVHRTYRYTFPEQAEVMPEVSTTVEGKRQKVEG